MWVGGWERACVRACVCVCVCVCVCIVFERFLAPCFIELLMLLLLIVLNIFM